jgi:ATP-dependent protease ClpP protease subunit
MDNQHFVKRNYGMEKATELPPTSVNAFVDRSISKLHRFYLSGAVKESNEYINWFETIRNSGEQDVIFIHINSYGGDLFTAIQFMRVLSETKATIIASVEGMCMSAATVIFLSARHWEISEHSMFMFHNYTSGSFGKGGELYDNIMHERQWSQKLLKDVYGGFLTEQEIKSILDNKDIWMSGEEVTKRLQKKVTDEQKTTKASARKKPVAKSKPVAKKAIKK